MGLPTVNEVLDAQEMLERKGVKVARLHWVGFNKKRVCEYCPATAVALQRQPNFDLMSHWPQQWGYRGCSPLAEVLDVPMLELACFAQGVDNKSWKETRYNMADILNTDADVNIAFEAWLQGRDVAQALGLPVMAFPSPVAT